MFAHFRPIFEAFLGIAFGIWLIKLAYYNSIVYPIIFASIVFVISVFILISIKLKDKKFWGFVYKCKWHVLVIAVSVGIGCGLYFITQARYKVDFHPTENVTYGITGTIDTNYIQTQKGAYFFIKDVSVINNENITNLDRGIYVYLYFQEEGKQFTEDELKMILPGNRILYYSTIQETPVFGKKEINSFAYKNNYQHMTITTIDTFTVFGGQMEMMDSLREHIRNIYKANMDERYAGLAFSVLIGDRTELERDIQDNFAISGIAHVVAVSGLNTAFIMMLLMAILNRCRVNRWVKLSIVVVVLLFYALLCDMTPSVVRASLMSIFLLISGLFGKQSDKLNSVCLSGILLMLISPLYIFDLSFLLSYWGVFGIFLLFPVMQKWCKWMKYGWLVDAVALMLAATISTTPMLINSFGYFSIIGLLANIVLVPLFGYAFMLLFFVTLIVLIMPFLAPVLKIIQYGFWLVDKGAWLCAIVPYAKVDLPGIPDWASVCFNVGMFTGSRFCLVSNKIKVILTSTLFGAFMVSLIVAIITAL